MSRLSRRFCEMDRNGSAREFSQDFAAFDGIFFLKVAFQAG